MSITHSITQISKTWENFSNLDIETALNNGSFNPWNNLDKDDYKKSFQDLKEIMDAVVEQNALDKYPLNIISSLQSTLNTVFQQIQQFVSSPQQNTFQNSLSQIESLRTNLRSWGVHSYVKFGQNIETKIQGFDIEYQKIIGKANEIETLKQSIENLIKPAVAGSLSKSFSDRQSKLKTNRNIWFWVAIIAGISSAIATVIVVSKLIDVFTINFPENATQEQIQTLLDKQPSSSGIQLLRIAIIFPFYYLFGISFNQYKRERNLEEEYAHRSAVSTSLPNYGDLASDQNVKDQIISSATQVIFTTPIDRKSLNKSKKENSISDLKGIIDSLGSIIKLKE